MYYDLFILASLLERPQYGYEIKKQLIEGFSVCSSISNNTLYPILKKFQSLGATSKTVEAVEGKPSRIVYHITDAGRRLFVERLRARTDDPLRNRDDFFMRLVYFHYLDRPTRVWVLDGRAAFLADALARLEERRPNAPYPDTVDFHMDLLRSERALIEKFRTRLDEPCTIDEHGVLIPPQA